jgi:tetratricopeptide (TPR) repeat protein
MKFSEETAETLAPVLAMIGQEARLDPHWTCHMLEAVNGQILPGFYRHQRDAAGSNAERIHYGLALASGSGSQIDDQVQLAHHCAAEDRLEDALYWIAKAIELDPEQGEYLRFKASILERMGNFEDALQTAHHARALGADPDCIASDIERIASRRRAELWEGTRSSDSAISLNAYSRLLAMKQLSLPNFLRFAGKLVKSYATGK